MMKKTMMIDPLSQKIVYLIKGLVFIWGYFFYFDKQETKLNV